MTRPSARLRLVIAFDGSAYQGWQTQTSGQGVQELVEKAIRNVFPLAGPLHGSSRTDTGVHARALVAHCDLPPAQATRFPTRKLLLAFNAHLPEDIRIQRVTRAHPEFHARFHALGKEYRYRIWNAPAAHPLERHTAWHVPRPLHLPDMRTAAAHFLGRHDFTSFTCNPGYTRPDTLRTLQHCSIHRRGPSLEIRIIGDGFLYRMCRAIAGTLVQVGLGRISPDAIPELLARADRRVAGMTAPPHGLILWKVTYPRSHPSSPPKS